MKTILILTSVGGGGQVTINQALHQSLGKEYRVTSELYFSNVINSVDPFSLVTFGRYSGEDFYNYFQKKRCFRFMQACYHASRWHYALFAPLLTKQTITYLEKTKPDLVISIIPIVNDIIVKSCQSLKIPLLIVPPDLDISFYTQELSAPLYKKLYIALPFDNPMSRKSLEKKFIDEHNIFTVKYPLRADFYEKKDTQAIKKAWSITDARPVILIMMGAQGNNGSYIFAKELINLKMPAHLIICIGKNSTVKKQIDTITFPDHITPHIVEYTERIADLMAIADVLISKTGAISVVEALHSKLPIIADQTEFVLSWEYFHQLFLQKYGCGLILKKISSVNQYIQELLSNANLLADMKKNIQKVNTMQDGPEIKKIIAHILDKESTSQSS